MINAKDAVIWVNDDTKEVMVKTHGWGAPEDYSRYRKGHWGDPIGAAYVEWVNYADAMRIQLMLETAIDLAMQGIPLKIVLIAFNEVNEFHALGSQSFPMCRALTKAPHWPILGTQYDEL